MISHSEVTQITQNDMIGTKLGVDLELRSGREVFLMKAWRPLCIGSPRAQRKCKDFQVSDEELPRKVSGGGRKCTLEEMDFPGNVSVRRAGRCRFIKRQTRSFCVS